MLAFISPTSEQERGARDHINEIFFERFSVWYERFSVCHEDHEGSSKKIPLYASDCRRELVQQSFTIKFDPPLNKRRGC